jgi:hypothetical protein
VYEVESGGNSYPRAASTSMNSLPPLLLALRFSMTGPIEEVMSAGCSDLPKSTISDQLAAMASGSMGRPSLSFLPWVRSQRSLAK